MNKFYIFIIASIMIVSGGCSSLDVAVSNKYNSEIKINKIVVFPFPIEGSNCGSEFSDAVSHQFIKSGKIDIVEREALDKILEEDKLTQTGLIDESQAAGIGKKLGVDAIILGRGTAGDPSPKYHFIKSFSMRMISVETGTHLVTVRMKEGSPMTYDDLAQEMVQNILLEIGKMEKSKKTDEKSKKADEKSKKTDEKSKKTDEEIKKDDNNS